MAAPDRLPAIPPSAYTPAQAEAAAEFRARRGAEPFGPYAPLLRSPKVMQDVEALGRRMRHGSCLTEDLKEMAICQVARAYCQQFEWSVHVLEAEKAGVSRALLEAIAEGRRPDVMTSDEALIHDAVAELIATKRWSDTTYARIVARHGEQGAVEIPALIGIYALLALVLNVARTPADGAEGLARWPE
ncbi:carboxymuconolactone decarboxylase family protein [Phreatobacter stygius]|uniref:Carboxymuconolactone decarboxylase family protein n=1 Tax=Phreatobacter stygius TaxID=1940610 RepID=A0A4D7B9F9_9HYPH|nr:carboxymuconolactone decarboxylase family protein [Phreatobacter stygius]QCI64747.1 carboxymuconolactone decarboxylase family protein [Phreatobacter stygius]